MNERSLQNQIEQFIQQAISQVKSYSSLRGLQRELEQSYQQLEQPMRVALVGKIKEGKSTLLNALLGEALVSTGTVEATFNVNWIRYGEEMSLKVHFKDNRPPEVKSFEELAALTLRSNENQDLLLSIQYIEVFYPNSLLQVLNLIDTPGLLSFYKEDSQNTNYFLSLHGDALTATTLAHAANADAVLYLFSRSIHGEDKAAIEQFQGAALAKATPINALGVLNRVDQFWPQEADPLAAGKRILERLIADHPQLNHLLYTIQPVCGLLALGAQTLTEPEFITLQRLAALESKRLESLLGNVERFYRREYPDEPMIPAAQERASVFQKLDRYGVHLACQFLREGTQTLEELRPLLLAKSGVNELRQMILNHFGRRAFLIKFNTCLQRLKYLLFQEQRRQQGSAKILIQNIASRLDQLEVQFSQSMEELQVLRYLYEDQKLANLSADEKEQLVRVLGEKGNSCGERLGLSLDASVNQLQAVADNLLTHWRNRANDIYASDGETIRAATILVQAYEKISYQIFCALSKLNFSEVASGEHQVLRERLLNCSEIPELVFMYISIPVKLQNREAMQQFYDALQQIKKVCFQAQRKLQSPLLEEVQQIQDLVDSLEMNEPGLQELKLWQAYDRVQLHWATEETEELLAVIGQKGTSCWQRLELSEEASLMTLCQSAEERRLYWLDRASDTFRSNSQTLSAAQILCQSYERIKYRLNEVRQLLGIPLS